MSGDEISSDVMGDFIDTCFNPINLQFFIHKTLVDDGYEVLTEDYTKCYYENKMKNHLGWFSDSLSDTEVSFTVSTFHYLGLMNPALKTFQR